MYVKFKMHSRCMFLRSFFHSFAPALLSFQHFPSSLFNSSKFPSSFRQQGTTCCDWAVKLEHNEQHLELRAARCALWKIVIHCGRVQIGSGAALVHSPHKVNKQTYFLRQPEYQKNRCDGGKSGCQNQLSAIKRQLKGHQPSALIGSCSNCTDSLSKLFFFCTF